jgi:hypothetical protein
MIAQLHPAIAALADKARRQHQDVLAVLGYGSALRDATPESTLVDLYVLTKSFDGVSSNWLARLGCRIAAPNVHYLEAMIGSTTYRAKYAVLPLQQFRNKCSARTANPYFWARFCQPVDVIWVKDEAARSSISESLALATQTAYTHAKALAPAATPIEQWAHLFRETYRTEFRPEAASRPQDIVKKNGAHYEATSASYRDVAPLKRNWAVLRITGKTLTILRLIKASFTFQGGPDYLAWKIKRHSGVDVQLTDFQRKHPLLASITLLPMLLRKGAVK